MVSACHSVLGEIGQFLRRLNLDSKLRLPVPGSAGADVLTNSDQCGAVPASALVPSLISSASSSSEDAAVAASGSASSPSDSASYSAPSSSGAASGSVSSPSASASSSASTSSASAAG